MIRSLAVLTVLALGLTAAQAQQVAPAAPAAAPPAVPAPAPADIEINPTTPLAVSSPQVDMMTGFYATLAVIDLCAVEVSEAVTTGMATDRARLEASLGLDAAAAAEAYAKVRAEVETTSPDCAAGSPDIASVDAVTEIYAQAAAAPAMPPAAEGAPAAAAAPAAPAAQ
tara:strand:+ start:5598 stop:6104 length:507 start_codon:yes stop_codon:yes gene_type:complete